MASERVRPIREGVTTSERKQQFLDHVASTYDRLAATDGREPVCIVFALVGESGTANTAYMTHSSIDDRNALHIARAVMSINTDYTNWDKETMNDADT